MTKPKSNRLGMYSDVRQIMNAVLESGGGSYKLDTYGQAVHWRQRAYRFRKLYAEVHDLKNESKYDAITMPRIKAGSSTVVLTLRTVTGSFTPTDNPVQTSSTLSEEDELLRLAEDFGKELER